MRGLRVSRIRAHIYNIRTFARAYTRTHAHARTHVPPLTPVNDKLHKTRAGLMPPTGYNVDRAFFRLAMQETLIIIREYNAFIFRRMPELLVRSLVRARARSLSIMEPRRALINGDGQIDDFLRSEFIFTCDILRMQIFSIFS